ncbi:MAG: BMP family lipoprotein [Methanoregula sp.]
MDRKYLILSVIVAAVIVLAVAVAVSMLPHEPAANAVYIVYGSEKGDLSYTDSAYQGLAAAQEKFSLANREFTPSDYETLPAILNTTKGSERPGLIITVGFQYAGFTRQLAQQYPDIEFLAIDQSGTGSGNTRSSEITSYGDSYLAGVLAASASKTGRVGIIMGMQSDVLDAFLDGYTDGARAVNSSISVDPAYVHQYTTNGFSDPAVAGQVAEGMYRNGTDVIFACAGYSNTGVFDAANTTSGRYVIGTDSDQSPLGPQFVLASAVKRVDRVVYNGIADHLNGSFTGGNQVTGLNEGVTGIVYNPKFAFYNETVSAWKTQAQVSEEKYLASRTKPAQK